MKAYELRIGNYVCYDSVKENQTFLHKVKEIQPNYLDTGYRKLLHIDHIFPVFLTEELLLKCGFEKDENLSYRWHKFNDDFADFVYDLDDNDICISGDWTYNKVKYLHQLQNLYFALSGEELNVEL